MQQPKEPVYLWGKLPPGPWVAIVGRRTPLAGSVEAAFQLAKQLASYGVTVISGGARGIDTAAHEGALAGGGVSVVVAPSWLHDAHPKDNRDLFDRIVRGGGGYLTVTPETERAARHRFLERNQVMAALSDAVVLGQTAFRGGGLNTMAHARKFQVPCFVLPCAFDCASRGSEGEVERGATLLWRVDPLMHLLEELGPYDNPAFWSGLACFKRKRDQERKQRAARSGRQTTPARRSQAKDGEGGGTRSSASVSSASVVAAPLGGERSVASQPGPRDVVWRAVYGGASTVEAICRTTALAAAEVQHRVLLLTLEGELMEDERGLLRPTLRGREASAVSGAKPK